MYGITSVELLSNKMLHICTVDPMQASFASIGVEFQRGKKRAHYGDAVLATRTHSVMCGVCYGQRDDHQRQTCPYCGYAVRSRQHMALGRQPLRRKASDYLGAV